MSLRKCHTFVPNLRAIQQKSSHHSIRQNSSHRSIRHHSNHFSRECLWHRHVPLLEFPNLSLISSFQDLHRAESRNHTRCHWRPYRATHNSIFLAFYFVPNSHCCHAVLIHPTFTCSHVFHVFCTVFSRHLRCGICSFRTCLSLISSFQDLRDKFSMFCTCANLWHL